MKSAHCRLNEIISDHKTRRTETYDYDDHARLVSVNDPTGTTSIEYDEDTEKIKYVVSP